MIDHRDDIKQLFERYWASRTSDERGDEDDDGYERVLPPADDAILPAAKVAKLIVLTAQGVRARDACKLLMLDKGVVAYALARGRHDFAENVDSLPARCFAGWQAARLRFAQWCLDRVRAQAEGGRDKGAQEARRTLVRGHAVPDLDPAPDPLEPPTEAEDLDDWLYVYHRLRWSWP